MRTALAILIIFIHVRLNAQVYTAGTILPYYYDINPDSTLMYYYAGPSSVHIERYNIDVNQDSQNDFQLFTRSVSSPAGGEGHLQIYSLNANSFKRFGRYQPIFLPRDKMCAPLQLGDSINSKLAVWDTTKHYLCADGLQFSVHTFIADFIGLNDLYIGIKYQDAVDTLYGWIRVNCYRSGTTVRCTIKDFSVSKCLTFPSVSISSSDSLLCPSNSAALTAYGVSTYSWSTGNTGATVVVTPSVSTTYSVTGTNANGCSASSVFTQSVDLSICSISSSDSLLCSSNSATLSATGASTYSWSTGNNGPSTIVTPSVSTTYSVTGTNANGCSASSVFTQSVSACIGIKEYENDLLKIYPNPASDKLNISSEQNTFQNTGIEIQNTLGQIVLQQPYFIHINISHLGPGIYHLHIIDNNKHRYSAKFIKE